MVAPSVESWIEKGNDCLRVDVKASDIRPLVGVACIARQREVVGRRCSSMLAGDDMVKLKLKRVKILLYSAILTTTAGARPNQLIERLVHAAIKNWSPKFA